MLCWLRIQNLALIEELTVEFPSGLIILTGETGAGKSIILGALQLLIGHRAEKSLIRSGTDTCIVEGIFKIPPHLDFINNFLEQHGIVSYSELLIKRIITNSGNNKQFINNSPVTLTLLQQIGEWLVDFHGPYDHQSLLRPQAQLELLDAYAQLSTLRKQVNEFYQKVSHLQQLINNLKIDERVIAQQIDILRYQIQEIESAKLTPGEEIQLKEEFNRLTHLTHLVELTNNALALFTDNETSITEQLRLLGRFIQKLTQIDPSNAELEELYYKAFDTVNEIEKRLINYLDRLQFDPQHFQMIEQRLDLLYQLQKKYGPNITEILKYCEEAKQRLTKLENREQEITILSKQLNELQTQLISIAQDLSQRRKKAAVDLASEITKQLHHLGFSQAKVEIEIKPTQIGPSGIDSVEFMFSPNVGESLKPLKNIASSGEIARVMLAIKSVLAEVDQVPILVFDEVDANVGGETAYAIGQKMRMLSKKHQIFCVTHLPTVAASATAHYRVWKDIQNTRAITRLEHLNHTERIKELTRMLGGPSKEAEALAFSLIEKYSRD